MIRINGSALISLGEILQDLLHVKPQQPAKENLLPLLGGGLLLANFLDRDNAFQLRVSQKKGQELQQCLDKLGQKKLPDELNHTDIEREELFSPWNKGAEDGPSRRDKDFALSRGGPFGTDHSAANY